jgi:hypothetical protein
MTNPLLFETLPLMVGSEGLPNEKLTDTTDICFNTMQVPVSNCCVCYCILGESFSVWSGKLLGIRIYTSTSIRVFVRWRTIGWRVVEIIGGQGRNRTADAGLFRAAYRIAEVV